MAKKTTRKAAAKRTSRPKAKAAGTNTRAAARKVTAGGKSVRAGVHDLSVGTFRERNFSLDDLPRVVHDVLSGAVDAVDRNIPKSRNNVLREVFDGLSQGINTVNKTGAALLNGRSEKTRSGKGAAGRDSHGDFLDAVSSFASRATRPVREELNSLVDRASRGDARSRRKGEHTMMDDAADTVREGVRSARRAADDVVDRAGDIVNGLMGRGPARSATKRRKPKPTLKRAVDRAVGKVTKPTRKAAKRR